MNIIKPSANVIALTTANTVYGSTLVYLAANAATLVTVTSNTSVVRGTFVVPTDQYVFVEKIPTDTLTANVAISATPAAFRG
jgi:hypothetical protein